MRTSLFACAVLVACLVIPVSAQTFGDISGEVRDTSGALVPGATVNLTNLDTNAVRESVSNESGLYSFPALPPGRYTIRVEKTGFKAVTRPGIELQVQQSARIDLELP